MKNTARMICYFAAASLLLLWSLARADAPLSCWKKVEIPAGTTIELLRGQDKAQSLSLLSKEALPVVGTEADPAAATASALTPAAASAPAPATTSAAPNHKPDPKSKKAANTIDRGRTVELTTDGGQVTIKSGPFTLATADARFQIPADARGLNLQLTATKGLKIKLPVEISDGKLPANKAAELVIDDTPITLKLVAATHLVRVPTSGPRRSHIDLGALPLTSGGRTLQLELFAPDLNQAQLQAEQFRACFFTEEKAPIATQAPLSKVVSQSDGHVTLKLDVPTEFNGAWLFNKVQLQISGRTIGTMTNQASLFVVNPKVAAIASIVIILALLLLFANRVDSQLLDQQNPTGGLFIPLLRFTTGNNGQQSLSLFQMFIWTVLVLVGMVYVFFMSGDLLNISQQVLVLVGLAGSGSIGARWIAGSNTTEKEQRPLGFWGMFIVNGKPDLLRLQLLLFTTAIWLYVAARVFYEQRFPELDANVLLLMGISNGIYLGTKWETGGNVSTALNQLKLNRDNLKVRVGNLQGELDILKTNIKALTIADGSKALAGKGEELKVAKLALAEKQALLTAAEAALKKSEDAFSAEVARIGTL